MDIGNRLELFVDTYLIEELTGAADLRLHRPTPREVAIVRDEPWEGNASGYTTVFQDGGRYRMYYRGKQTVYTQGKVESPNREVACYAESEDSVHWTKPALGIVGFQGSKTNNIIWDGLGTHNFAPFKDTRPDCPSSERYKALGGSRREGGLYAFKSSDGIHWSLMHDEPVITEGYFDSQNLAFWDGLRGEYRAYVRDFRDGQRDIRTATSKDFVAWTEPVWLAYTPDQPPQLYTNQVIPYYRAPHIFMGFPMRYIDRGWTASTKALPQLEYRRIRASKSQREGTALTDGMFMSSRDGQSFYLWPEAFIRPGLRTTDSWFYGDNYQNWGLVETRSHIADAPNEISIYVSEGSHQGKGNCLRRFTLRIDGFVSAQAPLSGGELITKPLIFEGHELAINFSTSAGGSIQVEIQDASGKPRQGFALTDCPEIFGDEIERVITWENGSDVGRLAGEPIRLRFVIRDADLYAFRFR